MGIGIVRLDVNLAFFLERVLGHERPDAAGAVQNQLVGQLRSWLVELWLVNRVLCQHDGFGLVIGAPWETLPELLSDEWHERMDQQQASLQSSVQGLQS